jgi:hypothetical protein
MKERKKKKLKKGRKKKERKKNEKEGRKERKKQDKQCTCKAIFWRLSLTTVAWKNQNLCVHC